MDIRCYDVEIRKDMRLLEVTDTNGNKSRLSIYSEMGEETFDGDINYQESAKTIAISIYREYLCHNAKYYVDIDAHILSMTYRKFGCEFKLKQDSGV